MRRVLLISVLSVASSVPAFAQGTPVQCPSGGSCTVGVLPVFTNPGTSTDNVVNSSVTENNATKNISTSAGVIVGGPGPWIDVTAPAYGAQGRCCAAGAKFRDAHRRFLFSFDN